MPRGYWRSGLCWLVRSPCRSEPRRFGGGGGLREDGVALGDRGTDGIHRGAGERRDREGDVVPVGASKQRVQFIFAEGRLLPVADTGRARDDVMDGGRGRVVVDEIAIQQIFREFAGLAQ